MRTRLSLIVITSLWAIAFSASAEPQLVWKAEGFKNPESALYDAERDVIYVSNVNGGANEKNGAGYLSRISRDGKVLDAEWVSGLNAPKGFVLHGNTLYVSDIDRLVAVDTEKGEITGRWDGEGAKFLNDLAVDENGRVFVSDMVTNSIYVLDADAFTVWLQDDALENPNGLRIEGDRLLVASWGTMKPDFSTEVPGHLKAVNLASKEISSVSDGAPIGNLDGLEPDGKGGWLTSDWIAGGLFRIDPDGSSKKLLDLNSGSADIEHIESELLVVIPMMKDGVVIAYRLK